MLAYLSIGDPAGVQNRSRLGVFYPYLIRDAPVPFPASAPFFAPVSLAGSSAWAQLGIGVVAGLDDELLFYISA
jgi:hypothetical protein